METRIIGNSAFSDPWDEFVRRANGYVDSGRLESEEIEYKIEIGRKLAEAREAVLAGAEGWGSLVKGGMSGNLIYPIEQSKFRHWVDESPDDSLLALRALWTKNNSSLSQRVREFSNLLPRSVSAGTGTRTNVISVLLMGVDVEQYPPFRVRMFADAYHRTGYAQPEKNLDEARLYEYALGFLDQFIGEAPGRGLSLRHRLDAQSLVWAVLKSSDEGQEEDDQLCENQQEETPESSNDPWAASNITKLADQLLWPPEYLQEIINDLQEKRQVIFYGPPGTGKTYVAQAIAQHCQENGGGFEIVQFHPSYSYEDFVEGFRPTLTDDGQAGFKLTQGPLRRIAEKAEANQNATFILVIDELNRGNVSKVLGELYFLWNTGIKKSGSSTAAALERAVMIAKVSACRPTSGLSAP